ncbi:hypothetical protein KKH13_04305 [Patescibacteria group bacterium]|nr:hypothetical protein [Patescibacteria group bacterium]
MAKVVTISPPCAAYSDTGSRQLIRHFPAYAAETWAYGDFLDFQGSNQSLAKCVAGDAAFVGMALSACPFASRDDLTEYPVLVFTQDTILEMNIWTNNTITSALNALAIATHYPGATFDLAIAASPHGAYFVVDIGATTDNIIVIDEVPTATRELKIGGGIDGDYYARINVRFTQASCRLRP